MSLSDLIQNRRDDIVRIGAKYGATNIRLFGSVARGESRLESDVDFLVEMQDGRSLLDLIGLGDELEDMLRRKVDVITDRGISPYLRDRIYSEAIPL